MSSLKNKPENKDADEIDLSRLYGELIDHRKLIISVTAFYFDCFSLFIIFNSDLSS